MSEEGTSALYDRMNRIRQVIVATPDMRHVSEMVEDILKAMREGSELSALLRNEPPETRLAIAESIIRNGLRTSEVLEFLRP